MSQCCVVQHQPCTHLWAHTRHRHAYVIPILLIIVPSPSMCVPLLPLPQVSDWPPRTLDVSYPLEQLLQPSACQQLFDSDRNRPAVTKCTVIACPLHTKSVFRDAYTQPVGYAKQPRLRLHAAPWLPIAAPLPAPPQTVLNLSIAPRYSRQIPLAISRVCRSRLSQHWAHMSPLFLDLPPEWQHLDWLTWWRALTQYLLRPGHKLLEGLASTLAAVPLLRSPAGAHGGSDGGAERLHRASAAERARAAASAVGFASRFRGGVASWTSAVRRPLIGVHVRLGDGCWDSKRGGCKYVRSFETILTRLRQAGVTSGTIFLATDNSTIAAQAVRMPAAGFEVLALGEDRRRVEKSHAGGDRRREGDEMLHLQVCVQATF